MPSRIANREDPDQTATSGLGCLSRPFCQATSVQNFRSFTIPATLLQLHEETLKIEEACVSSKKSDQS